VLRLVWEFVKPNVRAKPGPAGKRQARGTDDELPCTAGLALCCWGSA